MYVRDECGGGKVRRHILNRSVTVGKTVRGKVVQITHRRAPSNARHPAETTLRLEIFNRQTIDVQLRGDDKVEYQAD